MQPKSALMIGASISRLQSTGSKANWCHWFPIHVLDFQLTGWSSLKKLLGFLHNCLIYLWKTLRITKKNSNINAPSLRIPYSHRIRPEPVLFIFTQSWGRCCPLVILDPSLTSALTCGERVFLRCRQHWLPGEHQFDLFAAEEQTDFFSLVIWSSFFRVSLTLSPTPHASKVEWRSRSL